MQILKQIILQMNRLQVSNGLRLELNFEENQK